MALALAAVQGGAQALSRSLFASLVPRARTASSSGSSASSTSSPASRPGALRRRDGRDAAVRARGQHDSHPRRRPLHRAVLRRGIWILAKVDVEKGRAEARAA